MKQYHKRLNRPELQEKQILNVYNGASTRCKKIGLEWYNKANEISLHIASELGIHPNKVIGVISALSPAVSWSQNISDAYNLLFAYSRGLEAESIVVATYSNNKRKAIKILNLNNNDESVIYKILAGKTGLNKTASFYKNILLNEEYVTIDRHSFRIATGAPKIDDIVSTDLRYRLCVKAHKSVAERLNLKPYQLQAITWLAYRESIGFESADKSELPVHIQEQIIK